MATFVQYTMNFDTSTNANFQALWGLFDSCVTTVANWTYVAQTGDINPNTATAPGSGSFAGFRVYSTTSGGTTWYHRFDWGRDGNGPKFKHQCGTTVNGSGTLGGQTSTLLTTGFQNTNTSTNQSFQFAGAAGWMTLVLGMTVNGTTSNGRGFTQGFIAHGSVDASGATNGGFEIFYCTNTSSNSQYVPNSGVVPKQRDIWPVVFGDSTSDVIGTHIMIGHPMLWCETGANNTTLATMVVSASDMGANVTIPSQIYNATHYFLVTSLQDNFLNSNINLGFRFE